MSDRMTALGVTYGGLTALGPRGVIDVAEWARDLGYSSLWTVEANGTDAMTLLGAAAAAAPGLGLGTGIVPVQVRSPTLAAMSAATLQALAPDADVLLGVGVSAPAILGQHGQPAPTRPLAMMREYVALVRECLSGESVTFEGDFWQVKRFRLSVRLGDRRPKIVMAALNPQMLKLAGEISDGVLLNYLPASHVGPSVARVREGGDAPVYAYVHAAASDFEASAGSARRDLFNYAMADSYAAMFRAAGFADEVDELRERFSARDRDGAVAAISDRMVQAIDFIGSETEVAEFVKTYVAEGVEYPILMPLPWGEDRRAATRVTMEAAAAAVN